jgi:CRISPR-associated protein Csm3
MTLLTGLRIGDSKENVEIGGVDNPVIRNRITNEPYIPGSSFKGKTRCLLEQAHGENADSKCKDTGSFICQLFGSSENKDTKRDGNASRIIVRDVNLTRIWAEKLKNSEFTDMPYTEVKWENVIDRIKGSAKDPRQMERIPAGAEFDVNLVVNIFVGDDENKLIELLIKGIKLLQDDYLGGSGSRGYGQVKLELVKREDIDVKTTYVVNP